MQHFYRDSNVVFFYILICSAILFKDMFLVFMPVTSILRGFLTIIVEMFYCIPSEMLSLGLTHLPVFFQKDVKAINSSLSDM